MRAHIHQDFDKKPGTAKVTYTKSERLAAGFLLSITNIASTTAATMVIAGVFSLIGSDDGVMGAQVSKQKYSEFDKTTSSLFAQRDALVKIQGVLQSLEIEERVGLSEKGKFDQIKKNFNQEVQSWEKAVEKASYSIVTDPDIGEDDAEKAFRSLSFLKAPSYLEKVDPDNLQECRLELLPKIAGTPDAAEKIAQCSDEMGNKYYGRALGAGLGLGGALSLAFLIPAVRRREEKPESKDTEIKLIIKKKM